MRGYLPVFYCLFLMLANAPGVRAQQTAVNDHRFFTDPETYTIRHTAIAPVIDGVIEDSEWQQASWTADFQDIEGDLKPKPILRTSMKMLWDDSCLYIAARIMEPNVWATLKKHDDVIYHDNDFELFLNPNNTGHQYFEIECNALNTIFDLFLNKPYRDGGIPLIGWNAEGLRSAVKIRGTLNNAADTDEGWTLEMAIPFKSLSLGNNIQIPGEGTMWRANFSRVEWELMPVKGSYVKLKDNSGHYLPEHNWVWSPQGAINMHMPERWGYVKFTRQSTGSDSFDLPYPARQKSLLWKIYYRQKAWYNSHKSYIGSLKKLNIRRSVLIGGRVNKIRMEATPHQFVAFITGIKDNSMYSINQEGMLGNPHK